MTSGSDNYGIQIEGSATVVAGAMAAGKGARAEGSTQYSTSAIPADLTELREAISSLVQQLRASPPGVDDPDALAAVAESAQREAGKDKPDRHMLSSLLHALMAGLTNSAALAGAVVAIQQAVSVLL